jgi:hypothetical protein
MLSNVSWSEYLIGTGLLLAAYYLFVILKYYRQELKEIVSGKFTKRKQPEYFPEDFMQENSFDELEMVVNDLRYTILEKAGTGADKQILLDQLKIRLANYKGLDTPAYRAAINNYIMQHAKEICGAVFSEEELNEGWSSLPPLMYPGVKL